MTNIMTWDDIEKFMTDNPDTVLSIYTLEHETFLNDDPILLNGMRWDVYHRKFKQIPGGNIFGLSRFMIRDSLEPGLELDKLIAQKVLGWYQDSDIGGPRAWWFKEGDEGDIQENTLHLNRFSTDIKAAWDLAEKFKLCVVPFGDGWTATRLGQILVDSERNKAPTAPHAICLAALFYDEVAAYENLE